jgi:hypothetical protein
MWSTPVDLYCKAAGLQFQDKPSIAVLLDKHN